VVLCSVALHAWIQTREHVPAVPIVTAAESCTAE
jgi:hypothetical protein